MIAPQQAAAAYRQQSNLAGKSCPACGSTHLGYFCGGCGGRIEVAQSTAGPVTVVTGGNSIPKGWTYRVIDSDTSKPLPPPRPVPVDKPLPPSIDWWFVAFLVLAIVVGLLLIKRAI